MTDKEQSRLRILEMILNQQKTLFGAFSPTLTKVDKVHAWDEITDEGVKLGLIPSSKQSSPSYMRDIFWQNVRKRTLKKIDDHRATGAAGGKDAKLDDIDKLVLQIIGK